MLRAFFTSATGMRAQELMIDNTANNLANVSTQGFKRSQIDFADLLYAAERSAGTEVAAGQQVPVGLEIGSGVRAIGTTKVFTPGAQRETGNFTDVMIQGEGFFGVRLPNGQLRYTRDGAFSLNREGLFVTKEGYALEGATVQIDTSVSPDSVTISADGRVTGLSDGTLAQLGDIQLYRFINPAGLSSEGGNLYSETPASGTAEPLTPGEDGMGTLLHKFLEESNVEVVRELVALITAQRAYEINSRAIRAGDEMLSTTSQIVR